MTQSWRDNLWPLVLIENHCSFPLYQIYIFLFGVLRNADNFEVDFVIGRLLSFMMPADMVFLVNFVIWVLVWAVLVWAAKTCQQFKDRNTFFTFVAEEKSSMKLGLLTREILNFQATKTQIFEELLWSHSSSDKVFNIRFFQRFFQHLNIISSTCPIIGETSPANYRTVLGTLTSVDKENQGHPRAGTSLRIKFVPKRSTTDEVLWKMTF